MHWKNLEDHVRAIAALRWNSLCRSEHIEGVDYDGVVRISSSEIVIIEITNERNLDKVRADINKILPTRIHLAMDGWICRCFVVLAESPTLSMIEMGEKSRIKVCSVSEFEREFFDYENYKRSRIDLQFGSAVDAKSGENDPRPFIDVKYTSEKGKAEIGAQDIVKKTHPWRANCTDWRLWNRQKSVHQRGI